MREIEWVEAALQDVAALDKRIAHRVKQAIERFARTGAGNIKNFRVLIRQSIAFASGTIGFVSI